MLRVGIVRYLNAWPLAWSFIEGPVPPGFEPIFLPPAEVAAGMAAGELDVGLIPSVELQRIPDLSVIPGLSISSSREVRSVLLVSCRPVREIRRLALDTSSRTSAALVRILAADLWGIEPEYEHSPPVLEAMLATSDAALLIGDPALAVDRELYTVVDLAAAWRELTGLPFVFAVWAIRGSAESRTVEVFRESLCRGLDSMNEIVAVAVRRLGLAPDVARRYLTRHLSYDLGPSELESLSEFFRRAAVHGLVDASRPIRLVGAEAAAG